MTVLMSEARRNIFRLWANVPTHLTQRGRAMRMRCYFLRKGHIVAVEPIPGVADEQAIERGHSLFKAREEQLDGFEIWDLARVVLQHSPPQEQSRPKVFAFYSKRLAESIYPPG
jgi:hypothetical protein